MSAVDLVFRALAWIAGAAAGAMMALTAADVVMRYFLGSPIYGAFEATEIMMGLMVFLALPLATARREHIVVSILYDMLPAPVRRAATALFDLACAGLCGLLAWRLWLYGERLLRVGEVTLELRAPKGYIAMSMSVLLAAAALAFLVGAAQAVLRDPGRVGGQEKI